MPSLRGANSSGPRRSCGGTHLEEEESCSRWSSGNHHPGGDGSLGDRQGLRSMGLKVARASGDDTLGLVRRPGDDEALEQPTPISQLPGSRIGAEVRKKIRCSPSGRTNPNRLAWKGCILKELQPGRRTVSGSKLPATQRLRVGKVSLHRM